jgi:hypothetical protein
VPKRPMAVTLCLGLIVLSAFIWMTLGILITFGLHPAIPDGPAVRAGMVSGSIAAAGTLAALVILLAKRMGHAY